MSESKPDVRRVRDLMDPGFLHASLERLRSLGVPPFTGDHYAAALEELNRARGDAASSAAFFPRHRGLSLLQSSLATCIEAGGNDLLQEARTPSGAPSQVADQELRPGLDLFRRFGPCDPGWLGVTVAEGLRLFEARPEFPDRPAPSVELADEARVVLVGDWGTGLPGAQAVGRAMARELAAAAGRDRHLIHLGDVYYSGWKEEYERHFLRYWPHREGEGGLHSWTLNGNHDMYSGGHAYFDFLLRDARFSGQGRSSHFRLAGRHWQILGLDSAYLDQDLAGSQPEWVHEQVTRSGLRTMLLSHHQLFSAFESTPGRLRTRLRDTFAAGPIDAWFWGHEHRCIVYSETAEVRRPRCIGHGGVPMLLPAPDRTRPPGVEYFYDAAAAVDGAERWAMFGFVVLDFDGPSVLARYINQNGEEHHRETLT